jgi:hypothetical protein
MGMEPSGFLQLIPYENVWRRFASLSLRSLSLRRFPTAELASRPPELLLRFL